MNILVGIIFITVGCYSIIDTYKNPDSQLKSADLKGYLGGVCAVIIGIYAIFNQFPSA